MRRHYRFWVYIMSNLTNRVLYVGLTNDIARRVHEHANGLIEGFSKQYKTHKLVYLEEFQYVNQALAREEQLKSFEREWKIQLVESTNPHWEDLSSTLHLAIAR